jgi:3-oxoacyl-[acyl-carrier protein] reductase
MTLGNNLYPEGAALVVGGSGGTGQAISQELANNGVSVVLTYNTNRERAETLATRIHESGGNAEVAQLTMDDIGSIERTVTEVVQKVWATAFCISLSTGFRYTQVSISELTLMLWQKVLRARCRRVYIYTVVHVTLPFLVKGGGGQLYPT